MSDEYVQLVKAEKDPLGMEACYESVKTDIEVFHVDPAHLLGLFVYRSKLDSFFNKKMIDACILYLLLNNYDWEDLR